MTDTLPPLDSSGDAREVERIATAVMQWAKPHLKHIVAFSTLCEAIEAALSRQEGVGAEREIERWKGEVYLDLNEERNPGTDEFAKGFNYGLIAARDLIYSRLPALLAALGSQDRPAPDDPFVVSEEMVEAGARASFNDDLNWERFSDEMRKPFLDAARRCLTAALASRSALDGWVLELLKALRNEVMVGSHRKARDLVRDKIDPALAASPSALDGEGER